MVGVRDLLAGGDLRSDGLADEAVKRVLKDPEYCDVLIALLNDPDDLIRGRAADVIEKVARERPDLLVYRVTDLVSVVNGERLPMVRWHLAMAFGHLGGQREVIERVTPTLLSLLEDESVFVKSWAITSLCIFGRKYPAWTEEILSRVKPLESDPSIAVRARVRKAVELLSNKRLSFPRGWVKSKKLGSL